MAEFLNPRLASVEGLEPEKHIGAWAEIDEKNMVALRSNLKGVEDEDFHMINRSLVFDVGEKGLGQDWEVVNKVLLDKIEEAAAMTREKGKVKIFPAKVGTKEHPSLALFFSVRNEGETDNVLMLSFTYCYKGLIKPKEWGNKREIPAYPTVGGHNILNVPLLQEII